MNEVNKRPAMQDISADPLMGWVLVAAGLALVGWGIVFDPTITSGGLYDEDRIINLGLLAQKLMIFIGGCAVSVAGVTWLLSFGIRSDIRRALTRLEEPSPPAS